MNAGLTTGPAEDGARPTGRRSRLLVAGIGNIFLGDDAFGPEVINALRARPLPAPVDVADFGIRGMDLAYRLLDGYAAAVLVDAAPRGDRPGTLHLIEPDVGEATAVPEAHGMDPVKVLALAARLSDGALPRVVVLGCEPAVRLRGDEDVTVGLSAPVRDAVGRAATLLHSVARTLLADPTAPMQAEDATEARDPLRSRDPLPHRPPWADAGATG
ncbi:hydrogenase maturation protease [Streptomyces sp. TRM49041]|uniref:hydrogenase maturation protease n=1 Tax=Streptomyces sp. TRM49041 TaxID=2603216 RepID=UPI0011EEE7E8|nr:hydrogenase maturation protease [Streptomyces sp. TRM49041]